MKNTTRFALLANWFLGCLAIIYFGYQNLEEQRENFQITDTRNSEGYLQQLRTSLNLVVNSELKLLRVISDKIIKGTSYSALSAELKDFYTGSGKKIILVDELSHVDILYDIDSSSLSLEEFTQKITPMIANNIQYQSGFFFGLGAIDNSYSMYIYSVIPKLNKIIITEVSDITMNDMLSSPLTLNFLVNSDGEVLFSNLDNSNYSRTLLIKEQENEASESNSANKLVEEIVLLKRDFLGLEYYQPSSGLSGYQYLGMHKKSIELGTYSLYMFNDLEKNLSISKSILYQIITFLFLYTLINLIVFIFLKYHIQIKNLSERDTLTGIFNRRTFEENYNKSFKSNPVISLLLVDIDFFKKINDSFGHDVGDKVIIGVTKRIESVLRKGEKIYRFGGEEFLILLEGLEKKETYTVAERIREAVEVKPIEGCDVTVSVGFSIKANTDSTMELFKRADNMLYKAKKKGRNRVEW